MSVGDDTMSTRLYAGGQLLAESPGFPLGTVPAVGGTAGYRLEFDATRTAPWWHHATRTSTAWTFTSTRPAAGQVEVPPLVQIGHDLPLDLLDKAPDASSYRFTVSAGYQPGASGPGITLVQAWASFDDGATWRSLDLVPLGNGKLQAMAQHPALADTTGAVSLRVVARDAAGNGIDQTVIRAYGLRPSG